MGRDVARACAKHFQDGSGQQYLKKHAFRLAEDLSRTSHAFLALYGKDTLPQHKGLGYDEYHIAARKPGWPHVASHDPSRPKKVTAFNRGDISATLVNLYRGGPTQELMEALERYVGRATEDMPRFDGKIAIVLDASDSTRGYGEREYCCIAQSFAFALAAKKCCRNLRVVQVGGTGLPPSPQGPTDLAGALLDALDGSPDLIAIISDGYENCHAGDLERLVEALPQANIETPVIFCHSKFTWKDSLDLRRPAPGLAEIDFWHESQFGEAMDMLFLIAREARKRGASAVSIVRRKHVEEELSRIEAERKPWISLS
jgi:hypothetical protein